MYYAMRTQLFWDGNKRTARLLMNLILMQYGYPPAIINVCERVTYIKALENASSHGYNEDLFQLIIKCVDQCLKKYLLIIGLDDLASDNNHFNI